MTTRTYRQTRRADATEATREAIVAAAQALFREDPQLDSSLEAVAARAGVSTRSVIRHFGSKQGLLEAAIAVGMAETATNRRVDPGDVDGAIRKLVDHYERSGDEVMHWLSLAERMPLVRQVTEQGVEMHLELVEAIFAPDLEGLPSGTRRARRAALGTATDVYVWHLLRRREGLGREATRAAILDLVEAARKVGAASGTGAPGGATAAANTRARARTAGASA